MASISFMVTDNETGMMNNSFNFTEDEIKRIATSLKSIYKDEFEETEPQNITKEMLFSVFARVMMKYLLEMCYNEEVNLILDRARATAPPAIELRAR